MKDAMKVLVTGGEGMLGRAFLQEAANFPEFEVKGPGKAELDVREADRLDAWADWVEGGWIVHCAARVDVEGCAREPEAARQTIVEGSRNAAVLAAKAGARLLYPQSFLVYDGRANPIAEHEEPRPLSFYGELKLEGEKVVESLLDDPLVIRMAGFFGGEERDKNFVGRIIPAIHAAIKRGERRFEVGTRVWQPTWTRDLAANSLHLMRAGASRHYQMACEGHASFAELAHEIVVALGWHDLIEIVPVDPASVTQSELGRRPDTAILSCERLSAENMNLQRPWRTTVQTYLQHPFFDQYRVEAQP
jgi:dTDP-4-dehydrorhamnose reductase